MSLAYLLEFLNVFGFADEDNHVPVSDHFLAQIGDNHFGFTSDGHGIEVVGITEVQVNQGPSEPGRAGLDFNQGVFIAEVDVLHNIVTR